MSVTGLILSRHIYLPLPDVLKRRITNKQGMKSYRPLVNWISNGIHLHLDCLTVVYRKSTDGEAGDGTVANNGIIIRVYLGKEVRR